MLVPEFDSELFKVPGCGFDFKVAPVIYCCMITWDLWARTPHPDLQYRTMDEDGAVDKLL